MEREEALNVLVQVQRRWNGTGEEHAVLSEAISTLAKLSEVEKEEDTE